MSLIIECLYSIQNSGMFPLQSTLITINDISVARIFCMHQSYLLYKSRETTTRLQTHWRLSW